MNTKARKAAAQRNGRRYTQVALRIPRDSLDQLRAKAKVDGRHMSDILRGAIELYCRTQGLPSNQRLAYVDISRPGTPKLISLIEFQR